MEKAKKALIIVDVQNDFCPGGALPVPGGDEVIRPLVALMRDVFSEKDWVVVATKDWHPQKTSHFAKWPVHCVAGTKGARLHSDLHFSSAVGYIVHKGTNPGEDAYSGFDGKIHGLKRDEVSRVMRGIKLADFLRAKCVKEVYIGGLATDYCVKATALDAIRLGFETFLILDACRAVNINPDDGKKAIEEMKLVGVKIVNSIDIR